MSQPESAPATAFESPPVVEVVAAVALEGMSRPEASALLGAYWQGHLRHRFPRLEQQAPYFPTIEQFPSPGPFGQVQWTTGLPPTRLWALTEDGEELLQLQPGWFACNWRKVQPHREYDRWDARRRAFEHWSSDLFAFLAREGMDDLRVTQCEVTYINHIRAGESWSSHGHLDRLLNVSLGAPTQYPLEQVSAEAQFLMEQHGEPQGRLHIRVLPAYDPDRKTPLYVLELTARGAPLGAGLHGALQFMDLGRSAINTLFVSMTTTQMHEEWRREG